MPLVPSDQPVPAPRPKAVLLRQISSSVLFILGLVMLALAVTAGFFFYHLIFDAPVTDGLQYVFRLAFGVIVGAVLFIVGGIGLFFALLAAVVRPWGAK